MKALILYLKEVPHTLESAKKAKQSAEMFNVDAELYAGYVPSRANAYIKEHKLNKPENKRFILPDDKLRKILNVNESEEINYFILQKLISHHFPPSASKQAAAAAAK